MTAEDVCYAYTAIAFLLHFDGKSSIKNII